MIIGVLLSNQVNGNALKVALAIFILGYCTLNVWRLYHAEEDARPGPNAWPRRDWPSAAPRVGRSGGCSAGWGSGACADAPGHLPGALRQAIATSAAVICVTAVIGAGIKLSTLSNHNRPVAEALYLALLMAPTAVIGGRIGAG